MSNIPEASTSAVDTPVVPLSKKQQKKLAKQEKYAEFKIERRAKERAAKKRKRAERKEAIQNGQAVEPLSKKRRPAQNEIRAWDGTCILELAFDDKMTDKASSLLARRLCLCCYRNWSHCKSNSRTATPA